MVTVGMRKMVPHGRRGVNEARENEEGNLRLRPET
jgi:hypothetical protein